MIEQKGEKENKIGWIKKGLLILALLAMSLVFVKLSAIGKSPIDKHEVENQIQSLLLEQEGLVQNLQDYDNIQLASSRIPELKEKTSQSLNLNQLLIDSSFGQEKENLLKRQGVLENGLGILDKMEECISFYPQQIEDFNNCHLELEKIIANFEHD